MLLSAFVQFLKLRKVIGRIRYINLNFSERNTLTDSVEEFVVLYPRRVATPEP